ncbi:MAG: VCBS repeat-containing protein [Saprospiraceae bacterium]
MNALLPTALMIGLLLVYGCDTAQPTLFDQIKPDQSGIDFVNTVRSSDTFNILNTEYFYNGGGVGVGDFNQDGLPDVVFTGNQVDNRLYLNQGNLQFKDVTQAAGLQKSNPEYWSSGVNVLDINNDGLADIYICNTLRPFPEDRKNLLYINQGNNEEGIPVFAEMAEAYGLAHTSHSSNAQFFDYDLDGDLDALIAVNFMDVIYPNEFKDSRLGNDAINRDILLRNDFDSTSGHPVFTDVSLEAGLVHDGYSHSLLILDINQDRYPDVYVANDYLSDDILYVNHGDGTFRNQIKGTFKHLSQTAMGSDAGDINNDGQTDIFTAEMQPYHNKRKKLFQGPYNYQIEINTVKYQHVHQYGRNTLQLHTGIDPVTRMPVYSEVGLMAGVHETDWSWATLFADFDNDGWQDLYVANGFPKDVTDQDFGVYRVYAEKLVSQEQLLAAIPAVKSPNFMFRNQGDLSFQSVAGEWGLSYPSFSNGAVYADLDQDGDLDLVVNNIDDPAFLFRNNSNPIENPAARYLRVELTGNRSNRDALGSTVYCYFGGKVQEQKVMAARGYLSAPEKTRHFGLGPEGKVDSLIIVWPDGLSSKISNPDINTILRIAYDDEAKTPRLFPFPEADSLPLKAVAGQKGLDIPLEDDDFIDFNFQRTIPHKFSNLGPALAAADINGDGREDIVTGSGRKRKNRVGIQQANGTFTWKDLSVKLPEELEEDAGILLFDADGDGDSDLFLARGCAQYPSGHPALQDILCLNDGKGNFSPVPDALPSLRYNSSFVKSADFDRDGDQDLLVGGYVQPFTYPNHEPTLLLRNDTKAGKCRFTDISASQPVLSDVGLTTDALWTDFNDDGWPDLVLAAKWKPVQFLENRKGKLARLTASGANGWYSSLAQGDLDNDGDVDFVAGNYGSNLYFRCSPELPLALYTNDFDHNGSLDPFMGCYWPDSTGQIRHYFYHPLLDMKKQFSGIQKFYNSFGEFGETDIPGVLAKLDTQGLRVDRVQTMESIWIENLGDKGFRYHSLPKEAQFAPIFGILPVDLNGDRYLDLLLTGNDYGMEIRQGRADALNGLALINDKKKGFYPLKPQESGFFVPGEGRGLIHIPQKDKLLVVASQHNDRMLAFALKNPATRRFVKLPSGTVKTITHFKNGQVQAQWCFGGSGFFSQGVPVGMLSEEVTKIECLDQSRKILATLTP